jgi:hypothetical protein
LDYIRKIKANYCSRKGKTIFCYSIMYWKYRYQSITNICQLVVKGMKYIEEERVTEVQSLSEIL